MRGQPNKTYSAQAANALDSTSTDTISRLFSVKVFNGSGATVYLHVWDTTAAISGAPPMPPVQIVANGTGTLDYGAAGRPIASGRVRCGISSTPLTYTAVATNACWLDIVAADQFAD
jgi:hypothetical protein